MEIITMSVGMHGNQPDGGQTAVDLRHIIANTGVYPPAAAMPGGGNAPPLEKSVDWAKLAADQAAARPAADTLRHEEQSGREKTWPDPGGEAVPSSGGVLPPEDGTALREGKIAARPDRRQGIAGRGTGDDMFRSFSGAEPGERTKSAPLRDVAPASAAKDADSRLAPGPGGRLPAAGEYDGGAGELLPAGQPVNSRPGGEFLPVQVKTPDPLPGERQQTAFQAAHEMKNRAGERGGTLLYTFTNGKTFSDSLAVNQVQISFQGATVLTPSNRITQENLLANQREDHGYLVMPASGEQQRQQQQQDQQPGEEP